MINELPTPEEVFQNANLDHEREVSVYGFDFNPESRELIRSGFTTKLTPKKTYILDRFINSLGTEIPTVELVDQLNTLGMKTSPASLRALIAGINTLIVGDDFEELGPDCRIRKVQDSFILGKRYYPIECSNKTEEKEPYESPHKVPRLEQRITPPKPIYSYKKEPIEEGQPHSHKYRIEEPNGQFSKGVCLHCGVEKQFRNWLEETDYLKDRWNDGI